ncbi:hypothetical protein BD769DRAFT_1421350 [Suillus cothurnatus]|nr:hypothetical protein BD769DRAFT_1421350 [Suillus cothurnatus]
MCSFKLGVEAVREVNALETLKAILGIDNRSTTNIEYDEDEGFSLAEGVEKTTDNDTARKEHDAQVRLSAVVAYCGLVNDKNEIAESILGDLDLIVLLKDKEPEHQGRACAALPALCEVRALRGKLLKDDLIYRIVELCQTAGENRLIAMKTLSYLAQHFVETSDILSRRHDFIKEILAMLKDKCESSPINLISFLIFISAATDTLSDIRQIEIVGMLKKLIKRRDFFVTPAAVAALCEICKNGSSTLPIPVVNADSSEYRSTPCGGYTPRYPRHVD